MSLTAVCINICLGTQTALACNASKNPSVVQSRSFICLVWGKLLSSRNELFVHTCMQVWPQQRLGSHWAGRAQLSPAAPYSTLLIIIHCLVLSGIQEENRSREEGVPESPGSLPGQPRLQGTACARTVVGHGNAKLVAAHGTFPGGASL